MACFAKRIIFPTIPFPSGALVWEASGLSGRKFEQGPVPQLAEQI
jgi:hypothetical protein